MTHECALPGIYGPRTWTCHRCTRQWQLVPEWDPLGGSAEVWFPVTRSIPLLCRLRFHQWRIHSYSEGDVCARCDRKKAA